MALSATFFNLDKIISKRRRTFCLLILLALCLNFQSQNEASKWYFGKAAGLDFMSNPPTILTNNASTNGNSLEGVASIADSAGNLLFYTNGAELWDKTHTYMAGGFLIGSPSSSQSSLILKKPGSSHLYYIFTTGAGGTGPLAYSVVDMNLAAGNGSVTVPNTVLSASVTEKLNATLHCNGTDFWILAHKSNTNDFYAYLLTSAGVSASPVISSIGSIHAPLTPTSGIVYLGVLKISPTGKKIATAIPGPLYVYELFDFNSATGVISNSLSINSNINRNCEFSPDGTKFYTNEKFGTFPVAFNLLQWDLCAGSASAIIASQTTVGTTSDGLGDMQVGPYEKLYLAEGLKQTLAVINNPNALGASCNFVANAISLGTGTCLSGLPNFMGSTFRQKAKTSLSKTCGSASFSYTPPAYCANASYSVNSVQWSFGDPASGASNTSSLDNPVHVYPTNGTYTAQLTVQYDCYSDVIEQVVTIDGYPNLTISGRETICKNESTTLTVNGAASYSWSPGANSASISLSPSVTTIYTVTGSGTNAACASSKVLTVSVLPCTNLLEKQLNESVFLIYPNPANTQVTVEADSEGSVSFINTLGQKVLTQAIHRGKNKLTISDLPLGVYFVIGKMENSEVVLRFVKE